MHIQLCVVNVVICVYVEVCSSELGTTVECCIELLFMVRSETIIVVIALLVCHASYCVSVLKERVMCSKVGAVIVRGSKVGTRFE